MLPAACAGAGETLVLLHGLGTNRADFARIRDELAKTFSLIAFDLPGQGDAEPVLGRPTVAALADAVEGDLDARRLGRVHLLGNSLGGRVALELARRHRARSVVAIAPSGLSSPPERLFQMAAMAAMGLIVSALRPVAPSRRRHLSRALLVGLRALPWKAGPDETDALARGFGSTHFWSLLLWAIGTDVPSNLDAIDCPVLLLQGAGDLMAAGQTIRFLAWIPKARFQLVPFAGHAAHGDAPSRIAALVRATAARAS
jgi:pimeloyl-ACP methyl ester carboxylesterase